MTTNPTPAPLSPEREAAIGEQITTVLSNAGAFCGTCGFEPGDRGCPDCERCYSDYTAALLPVVRAAVAAEQDWVRAELVRERRANSGTIDDRDRAQDAADKLAYAIAPVEVIGEHSGGNCPWANALEHVTPAAKVDQLKKRVAELEGIGREAATALDELIEYCDDPGTANLGTRYRLKQALIGSQPHCTAEYGGPGYTHCELPTGHDGQHESALGNMRRATWGGGR